MKKILVVDDEQDILKTISYRLKKAGYDVTTAINGKETFDALKGIPPDLMILDYKLPDTNGGDIARQVRRDEQMKNIPIILISASSSNDLRKVAQDVFINEFLKKPFEPEELMALVKKYI